MEITKPGIEVLPRGPTTMSDEVEEPDALPRKQTLGVKDDRKGRASKTGRKSPHQC